MKYQLKQWKANGYVQGLNLLFRWKLSMVTLRAATYGSNGTKLKRT